MNVFSIDWFMMDWEEKTKQNKQKTKINLKHGHSAHQSDSL